MKYQKKLSAELEQARVKIQKVAKDFGLDFYETIFEVITYDQMNQFAAYGGFPVRYPHWKFGMEYEKLSKSYEYGLSKIYEMVINNNPCYAYLMEGNKDVDQKLVMAHVFGHGDFFKNNKWFSPTNRKMMDTMANHATRIRRYIDRYGVDTVENFVDCCLSLENLIDRYSPYSPTSSKKASISQPQKSSLFTSGKDFLDEYIHSAAKMRDGDADSFKDSFTELPNRPEKDVLLFLMSHAPLKNWQQDILSIIRAEAYYFVPQGMTKIMNEGWASYWHSRIMTEKILNDSEVIDYADACAGTLAMSPTGFNPYKVGIELFRDIHERWDKGRFGREWNDCSDINQKKNWNQPTGKGIEKIFEVRRDYNDVTFVDEFLTEDFCVRNKMFVYGYNKRTGKYEVDTRNFPAVKQQLLFQLTNFGQPIIQIEHANYKNRGELLLRHVYEGAEMQGNYTQETLKNLQFIWKRPVNLITTVDNKECVISYDGKELTTTETKAS